jgi:transcriptional regulator with XRE-family HTH domain
MNDNEIFPERLKTARELRQMSQVALAEKARTPATTISHFEAGSRKPSFDSLRRLAKALEVTTDYLLGLAASPTQNAEADPLFRHGQNLTGRDREIAREIVKLLAERNESTHKSSDEEQEQ